MPRVYFDYRLQGQEEDGGDPIDLCAPCWTEAWNGADPEDPPKEWKTDEEEAEAAIALRLKAGDLDVRGDDHPGYEGEGYDCNNCRKALTGRDD